jgi:hypothetical protein
MSAFYYFYRVNDRLPTSYLAAQIPADQFSPLNGRRKLFARLSSVNSAI